VVRGFAADAFAAISRSGDIVVIMEPASPAERMTQQFLRMQEAGFPSAAAVLIMPPQLARRSGAVVAVAATPNDPSIQPAAEIAAALKQDLLIIEVSQDLRPQESMVEIVDLKTKRVFVDKDALSRAPAIASVFRQLNERLVVITRGAFGEEVPSLIASLRSVPVLVIEAAERSDEDILYGSRSADLA
jgi:hypothetical protein